MAILRSDTTKRNTEMAQTGLCYIIMICQRKSGRHVFAYFPSSFRVTYHIFTTEIDLQNVALLTCHQYQLWINRCVKNCRWVCIFFLILQGGFKLCFCIFSRPVPIFVVVDWIHCWLHFVQIHLLLNVFNSFSKSICAHGRFP